MATSAPPNPPAGRGPPGGPRHGNPWIGPNSSLTRPSVASSSSTDGRENSDAQEDAHRGDGARGGTDGFGMQQQGQHRCGRGEHGDAPREYDDRGTLSS